MGRQAFLRSTPKAIHPKQHVWLFTIALIIAFLIAAAWHQTGVQAANGDLDPSFTANVFDKGVVSAMARQSDGKVVVIGSFASINGVARQNVARLNADGTLDQTFDPGSQIVGEIDGVAVQPDGKVLLGGFRLYFANNDQFQARNLVRLNADGSIDKTFDTLTFGDANSTIDVIKVLANGQILIGGGFTQYQGTNVGRLARLNPDSSIDSSFNVNHGVDGTLVSGNSVFAIAFQSDGKILIGGIFNFVNSIRSPNFARLNADASTDTTFSLNVGDGANGQTSNYVRSIAIQNDGKIVIGGLFLNYDTTKRNCFARVNADGSLDTVFNNGTGIGGQGPVNAVAIQTDNKILVVGDLFGYNGVTRGRIARINSDGSLDTSFDPGQGFNDTIFALILQPNGSMLLGGRFTLYKNTTPFLGMAQVNPDSSVDSTYSAAAVANRPTVRQIAAQSDGKVLIGGDFVSVNGSHLPNLARLNANGTVDTSFTLPSFGFNGSVYSIVIQPDQKILVGGTFNGSLFRLNPDGSQDTTFNNGMSGSGVRAIALQPDGKLFVAGGISGIAKLNANGSQTDVSFLQNVNLGFDGVVFALALQSDGKVVVGGDFAHYNSTAVNGIARLNANGTLDSSFNIGNGFLNPGIFGAVRSLTLQPDGKIIAGGHFANFNGTSRNGVARLNVDGTLDTGFDPGTGAAGPGASPLVETVLLQPSGKIVIGGNIKSYNGTASNNIVRVNTNGSLDTGFSAATGPSSLEIVTALAMQADGKVIVGGGFLTFNGTAAGSLVRLLADGAATPTPTPTATPTPSPSPSPSPSPTATPTPAVSTIQFNASSYTVGEGDMRVDAIVSRSGDTSGAASVSFATSDVAGAQRCNIINSRASSRCDYEARFVTVKFASGETSKTVSVFIIDDSYQEGPETFSVTLGNPVGATLGTPSTAIVTIADNDLANGANPIDNAGFFVRLHYLDFLNREPDSSGFDFWTGTITSCGGDQQCVAVKRVNASAGFYVSIEFQQTGYFVERLYKAAYGDTTGTSTCCPVPGAPHSISVPVIRLNEFLADTQEIDDGIIVGQGNWQQQLETNKQALTAEFVQRPRFTTAFAGTMTPAQFVDLLFSNARVTPSSTDRNAAIAEFGAVNNTTDIAARVRALRDVAENAIFNAQEFNRAFVLMQYFGYLRRNPNDFQDSDYTGYDFWLTKLSAFNGNVQNAEMVNAFLLSDEYRQRFGP